jgi:amino acid transporter
MIGWALIMEYAVGNTTVAVSWSDYFTGLLESLRIGWLGIDHGLHVPAWASVDFVSARQGHAEASVLLAGGQSPETLTDHLRTCYLAWTQAPRLGSFPLIADWPALAIVAVITWVAYIGIRETRNAGNALVVVKLVVILAVIAVGAFHVDPANWRPFLPNGAGGVLAGVSAVFFAYIGFDAISTTAEECKNPARDLPRGILYAIVICTALYVLIALVLTGLVRYDQLRVGDPLAFVFQRLGLTVFSGIVAVSAVVAITGVLLVFQVGQPRIWMSMSRDGLLPRRFARIHRRHRTPSFATVVTGFAVAVPTLCIPGDVVLDLCSMGTLFAFVLVCAGVLRLQNDPQAPRGRFRTPYVNGRYVLPPLAALAAALTAVYAPGWPAEMTAVSSWSDFGHRLPMWLFLLLCAAVTIAAVWKNLSLIPSLGLIFCFYMMAQIPWGSWKGFLIWLAAGLVIYFGFGYRHSKLRAKPTTS